jgi:hypothetical protein
VRAAAKVSPSPRAWGTGSANDDCSGCGNEPRIPRLTCQKQCGRGYCGDGCFSHRGKNPATSCQCRGGMSRAKSGRQVSEGPATDRLAPQRQVQLVRKRRLEVSAACLSFLWLVQRSNTS